MGVNKDNNVSLPRLKREDCKRTKHDSVFSPWTILIGPSDWESHSKRKDGVEKYRIHNLPSRSCTGLYELGVAASHTELGRDVLKLDQDRIIVVYLGQADNVRTRLQHYGRGGSHLEHGNAFDYQFDDNSSCQSKGLGLFREIFSRGFPIVFRWAPMESKKVSERTEAQLLGIFDYAWNKVGNGARRPNDIHLKLDRICSSNVPFISIARKLRHLIWKWNHPFCQKEEGIMIKALIFPPIENRSSTCNDRDTCDHSSVSNFDSRKPRLGTDKHDVYDGTSICRLSLHDGSVCTQKLTEGTERQEEQNLKSNWPFSVCLEVPIHGRKSFDLHKENCSSNLNVILGGKLLHKEFGTVCGVALEDGSVCENNPVEGRKRCKEHKGRRINGCIRKSETEGKLIVCGVGLGNGPICMEVPVPGRKRCELHKGKRLG